MNLTVVPNLSQYVFCENLGLNPNLLKLFRAVIYTDSENDTGITWLQYLELMAVFYLRKRVLRLRVKIYLNLLQLRAGNYKHVLG